MHLAVNSYTFNNLGPTVERLYGGPRFLAVYLLAAVGGNVASYLGSPNPSLGASGTSMLVDAPSMLRRCFVASCDTHSPLGAVFGVGGALAVFFYRHKDYFGKTSDAVLQSLGQSLVINLGYGLMSRSVDNWYVGD